MGNKLLTAKAGLNGHNKCHIYLGKERIEHGNVCCGLDGNSRLYSERTDVAKHRNGILAALVVDGYEIRACLDEILNVSVGINNHKVNVEKHFGVFSERAYHRCAKAHVRNEKSVHNVKVQIFRACVFDLFYVFAECGEVCGKNRG